MHIIKRFFQAPRLEYALRFSLPLHDAQRRIRSPSHLRHREGKHRTGPKRRRGNAVEERRAITYGFGSARTGGNRLYQLRSVTEPPWTGGSLRGCCCCSAPPNCSDWALALKTSAGLSPRLLSACSRIYEAREEVVFGEDAGSELPGSRVLGGGAGRETLQKDESNGWVEFSCRRWEQHECFQWWARLILGIFRTSSSCFDWW